MKVLIACEYSATVRDAFRRAGHNAWSCDLLPTDGDPKWHHQCNVFDLFRDVRGNERPYDLIIAHPPCTHLAVSGAPHFKRKQKEQAEALEFVRNLMGLPCERICIENPVSIISSRIRKPDQIIQPYQFGHAERKTTCLWLKGLPLLTPTSDLKAETEAKPKSRQNPLHYLPPSTDRWKLRSKTYQGIADAMASQWGNLTSEIAA